MSDLVSLALKIGNLRLNGGKDEAVDLLDCRSRLSALKVALGELQEDLDEITIEHIREYDDIRLGPESRLGISRPKKVTVKNRREILKEVVYVIIDSGDTESAVDVLDRALSKSAGGPWTQGGLEDIGIDPTDLYLREGAVGKDGEPVYKVVVKMNAINPKKDKKK